MEYGLDLTGPDYRGEPLPRERETERERVVNNMTRMSKL